MEESDVKVVEEPAVDEQPQEEPKEEKTIDLIELAYNKLNEIHQQRHDAISDEDRMKGTRLIRSPYDDLWFETFEEFREELDKINHKTSNLSASRRKAMLMLRNYVLAELTSANAQADSANEEALSEEPEATDEKPDTSGGVVADTTE